jgi:hypothetical protein
MISSLRSAVALGTLAVVWAAEGVAQGVAVSGDVAVEVRVFPQAPLFPDQHAAHVSPSLRLAPEVSYEWHRGAWRVMATMFLRVDAHDDRRTHADLRELGVLHLGRGWAVFAGFGKVFWGVTEVRHLVDIINQTDQVEDIDNEDKLGQPMINLTLERSWGALDFFYLPMFRERTFPGDSARLRGPLPITDEASYESSAGRWHQDFAVRWSHIIGEFDVALAFFRGTSREAQLVPVGMNGELALQPHYDVIDQASLELQWTKEAVLWKLEALTRGGQGNRFVAAVAGVEYTLFQVFPGTADLGLLAEFLYDGRDDLAPPTIFDNDVFLGFRWAFNDVSNTSVLGGPVVDFQTGEVFALLELERRLASRWRFELEGRWLANTDPESFTRTLRKDNFVALRLSWFI